MTHTPSGQQAVEPVLSAAETADRLEAWAREMLASTPPKTGALHLLDAVHYLRTAAPTAPSTAAGEPALVCGCGWEGSYADLNETAEGMTCPKCRLSRNMDCAATPPAQGVAQENLDHAKRFLEAQGFQVFSAGPLPLPTTPPAPSVPWQEQAARQCEEWADKLVERASAAPSTFERIQFNADAVKLRDHARAFRALLSKPAKGDQ